MEGLTSNIDYILISAMPIEEALSHTEGFTNNTDVKDKYGNVFKVPKGFKIAIPTTENAIVYKDATNPTVQEGIVIEDVSASEATKGNQFVWIPVGTLKNGNEEGVSNAEITLERRTFNKDGTVKDYTENGTEALETYYIEETPEQHETSGYTNAIAKDIEKFKTSVKNNGGYYLARFEASNEKGTAKSVKGATAWAGIKQTVASDNCQAMYNDDDESLGYQSDLTNSYAWDTAIYFIQECSNEKAYAMKRGTEINVNIAKTGSNNDRLCNICDMAGNLLEWSTETYANGIFPCIDRGSCYGDGNHYTSSRAIYTSQSRDVFFGFRPIIYVK